MRFQLLSDIHLEFYNDKLSEFPLPKIIAPYLILAGDIGNPFLEGYKLFLEWCSQNFKQVFIVSGNHEYYQVKQSMSNCNRRIYSICNDLKNINYLHMSSADIIINKRRIKILGTTLWTYLDREDYAHASLMMNDYRSILKGSDLSWTPEMMVRQHTIERDWIVKKLSEYDSDPTVDDIIVITHHPPSFQMTRDYSANYGSDLDSLIVSCKKMRYWCSGHTHITRQIQLEHVTLIANCVGYPDESTNYDLDQTFEISI